METPEFIAPGRQTVLTRIHLTIKFIIIIIIIIIINEICRARKFADAANAPSQLLHDNSYPRTGTFSVVS